MCKSQSSIWVIQSFLFQVTLQIFKSKKAKSILCQVSRASALVQNTHPRNHHMSLVLFRQWNQARSRCEVPAHCCNDRVGPTNFSIKLASHAWKGCQTLADLPGPKRGNLKAFRCARSSPVQGSAFKRFVGAIACVSKPSPSLARFSLAAFEEAKNFRISAAFFRRFQNRNLVLWIKS